MVLSVEDSATLSTEKSIYHSEHTLCMCIQVYSVCVVYVFCIPLSGNHILISKYLVMRRVAVLRGVEQWIQMGTEYKTVILPLGV